MAVTMTVTQALELMGLSGQATQQDLRKAYSTLAFKFHPDVSTHPSAHEMMQKVNAAYETLSGNLPISETPPDATTVPDTATLTGTAPVPYNDANRAPSSGGLGQSVTAKCPYNAPSSPEKGRFVNTVC